MFHSKEVLDKVTLQNVASCDPNFNQVKELSKKFGTPHNHIFPVRNYDMETECNLSIDILNLRAQRQILRYSVEYLEDKIALESAERRTRDREVKQDERQRRSMGQDRSMSGADSESEGELGHRSGGKEKLLFKLLKTWQSIAIQACSFSFSDLFSAKLQLFYKRFHIYFSLTTCFDD